MGALAGLSGLSGISFCNAGSGGGGGGDVDTLLLDTFQGDAGDIDGTFSDNGKARLPVDGVCQLTGTGHLIWLSGGDLGTASMSWGDISAIGTLRVTGKVDNSNNYPYIYFNCDSELQNGWAIVLSTPDIDDTVLCRITAGVAETVDVLSPNIASDGTFDITIVVADGEVTATEANGGSIPSTAITPFDEQETVGLAVSEGTGFFSSVNMTVPLAALDAPVLTLEYIDYRFGISWTSVPEATSYDVYVDGVLRFPTQSSPAGFDVGGWEYATFTVVAKKDSSPSNPSNAVSGVSFDQHKEYPTESGSIDIDALIGITGSFLPYAAVIGAGASGDALGGGGGGGSSHRYNIPITAHASYPFVIGAAADGEDGEDSVIHFDTDLTAGGGKTFTNGGAGGIGDFAGGDGFALGGGGSGAAPFAAGNPGDASTGGEGVSDGDISGGAGGAPGEAGGSHGGGGGTGDFGVSGDPGAVVYYWYRDVSACGFVVWDKFGGLGNLTSRPELMGKNWVYAGDLIAHVNLRDGTGVLSANPAGRGVAVLDAPVTISGDYYIQLDMNVSAGIGIVFNYINIGNYRRIINDGTNWRYQRIFSGTVAVNTILDTAYDTTAYVNIGPALFTVTLNTSSAPILFAPTAGSTIGICYGPGATSGSFEELKVVEIPTIAVSSSNVDGGDNTRYIFNFAEDLYIGSTPVWRDHNGNAPTSMEDLGGGSIRLHYAVPVAVPILVPPGDQSILDSATFSKSPASGAYS